jgi:hypothetical protein
MNNKKILQNPPKKNIYISVKKENKNDENKNKVLKKLRRNNSCIDIKSNYDISKSIYPKNEINLIDDYNYNKKLSKKK